MFPRLYSPHPSTIILLYLLVYLSTHLFTYPFYFTYLSITYLSTPPIYLHTFLSVCVRPRSPAWHILPRPLVQHPAPTVTLVPLLFPLCTTSYLHCPNNFQSRSFLPNLSIFLAFHVALRQLCTLVAPPLFNPHPHPVSTTVRLFDSSYSSHLPPAPCRTVPHRSAPFRTSALTNAPTRTHTPTSWLILIWLLIVWPHFFFFFRRPLLHSSWIKNWLPRIFYDSSHVVVYRESVQMPLSTARPAPSTNRQVRWKLMTLPPDVPH